MVQIGDEGDVDEGGAVETGLEGSGVHFGSEVKRSVRGVDFLIVTP